METARTNGCGTTSAPRRDRSRCVVLPKCGQDGRYAHAIVLNRAAAGVRIFVLYDGFGTPDISREHVESLRRAGVSIEPFRPVRIFGFAFGPEPVPCPRNRHRRPGWVDWRFRDRRRMLGDGRSNGSWRETNVRFEGPAVKQLQAAFATAWTETTGVLFTGRTTLSGYADGVTAGLLYATTTLVSTAAERFLAASISGSRESLYITNSSFAPDDNMVELLTAAERRGVDVRLLTAGAGTDVRTVRFAGRASYDVCSDRAYATMAADPFTSDSISSD